MMAVFSFIAQYVPLTGLIMSKIFYVYYKCITKIVCDYA